VRSCGKWKVARAGEDGKRNERREAMDLVQVTKEGTRNTIQSLGTTPRLSEAAKVSSTLKEGIQYLKALKRELQFCGFFPA
jgi:hypothetical protein